MFDKNAVKQDFSRAAWGYDKHAKLQEEVRKKATILAGKYFSNDSSILDVGCGTGMLAQEQSSWNIIGADISFGMCKVANEKSTLVVNADAGYLPFKDATIDNVFSSLFLQWAPVPELIIKEMLRVLKPNGTAVVTTFTKGTLKELEQAFLAVDSAPHISNFIEKSELLSKVTDVRGKIIEFDEYTYSQYHDDILSLMHSIKKIGASNKHKKRRKGLMTASHFRKVEAAYPLENGKFVASWNVLTMAIGKM